MNSNLHEAKLDLPQNKHTIPGNEDPLDALCANEVASPVLGSFSLGSFFTRLHLPRLPGSLGLSFFRLTALSKTSPSLSQPFCSLFF